MNMTKMSGKNPNFKATQYVERNSESRKQSRPGLFESVASRKTQRVTSK